MTASKTTLDNIDYCINTLKLATKILEWERIKAEQGISLDETSEQTILDIAIDHDLTCAEVYEVLSGEEQQRRDSILRSLSYYDTSRDDD